MFNDEYIKPIWKTGEKYICKQTGGKFSVRKVIKGKLTYFGTFKTLEEAAKYRDYCIIHDWDRKCRRKMIGHLYAISPMEMSEGVRVV